MSDFLEALKAAVEASKPEGYAMPDLVYEGGEFGSATWVDGNVVVEFRVEQFDTALDAPRYAASIWESYEVSK